MASTLVIIEAPGKRACLSDVLWRAGMRDFEVMATAGHIAANPSSLRPLAITSSYRETQYRVREDRAETVNRIRAAANAAAHIYLATDDDDEGDVIARDVCLLSLEPEDRGRVQRVRLRALSPAEVAESFKTAKPLDAQDAARGDARRVLDRMVGALSSAEGAVGRVQGSLLLALTTQLPVVGVATYVAPASDGGSPWIARKPLHAGEVPDTVFQFDEPLSLGREAEATLGSRPQNFNEIVLSASIALAEPPADVADAMQSLYERGKLTYPRSRAHALSDESARRLDVVARMNGAAFDAERFTAVRSSHAEGHEAPNPAALDVPLNRDANLLSFDERVWVHITRQLVDCGVRCVMQLPKLGSVARLPGGADRLAWHRQAQVGERLYEGQEVQPGVQAWTPAQSLLHLMTRNDLGRPSTALEHIGKFMSRGLVDEGWALTHKGQQWAANVGALFQHQNLARLVDEYLEANCEAAALMVASMVEKFGIPLPDDGGMLANQELENESDNAL